MDETIDSSSVTIGVQFYSDVPGSVTGVRFYKGADNTGTHVGALWSSTGEQLASVTFSGETASGWQQANFSSPVNIAANTIYVVSYFAPHGNYADNEEYGWSTLSASPLHVSGASPGVFAYGTSDRFPNSTWEASNYWVDLVFAATGSAAHSVSLSWTASASSGISGYNVYRSVGSGGPYTLLNQSLIDATSYVDNSVTAGDTYYYVVTAVNSSELQSADSNQAATTVP